MVATATVKASSPGSEHNNPALNSRISLVVSAVESIRDAGDPGLVLAGFMTPVTGHHSRLAVRCKCKCPPLRGSQHLPSPAHTYAAKPHITLLPTTVATQNLHYTHCTVTVNVWHGDGAKANGSKEEGIKF